MKLLTYGYALTFIFQCVTSMFMPYDIDCYIPFILDIRKYYAASSVFFLHPGDRYGSYEDLGGMHVIHTWSRMLSREGIITVDVNYNRIFRIKRYINKIVRPLAIVFIPTMNETMEFSKASEIINMSFAAWFVIFMELPKSGTPDYCHHPPGNVFNVAFDTNMLVMCAGDRVLREWYSVDGLSTEIFDLATWEPNQGFALLTHTLLYERRSNMKGTIMKAVAVQESPFMRIRNGSFYGLFAKIVNELSRSLNFTIEVEKETLEYGAWNAVSGNWSGGVAEVAEGRVALGISDFSMTARRMEFVDYTIPLLTSKDSLYCKQSDLRNVQWAAYFQVFSLEIWVYVIAVITITPFALILIQTRGNFSNAMRLTSNNFLYVWGIFCQQGLTEFPKETPMRLAYITIFATAFIIYAAYSAALICFLTSYTYTPLFSTFEDVLRDGTYKLVVFKGSADYDLLMNSNDELLSKAKSMLIDEKTLPHTLEEAFNITCKNAKVILFLSEAMRNAEELVVPCKLFTTTIGRIDPLSIILSKGNPFTRALNFHLQRYVNNGMMKYFKDGFSKTYFETEIRFDPMGISNIAPILAIFGGGVLLGIIIMLLEIYAYDETEVE